jgi:filamentous hemagglutinin family protein
MKSLSGPLTSFVLLPLFLTLNAKGAIAQITPTIDGTGTLVKTQNDRIEITGGTQAGGNLFHSFQQFGVNAGQTANFISHPNTVNVLGRVTGGNVSLINGILQVSGSNANLYLINPAGIVFGKQASLNIPAAFTATTANGIGFGNGQWFNATGSNNYGILTANPSSFGFIGPSGSLVNAGNLTVNPGQRITLVGGTVVNTGTIAAPGGNITIAAIPGEKLVRIGQEGMVLSLDLPTSDQNLINKPITTPLSLPELLTGGSVPSAMGVVIEDGVIKLTGGSASVGGSLNADGMGLQSGGNVVAYADNHLDFGGVISAKGGELGGNGGFVDTSGKGTIAISPNAKVLTTAAKGNLGTWLIDPANLEVVAAGGTGAIVTGTNSPLAASTINANTIVAALNGSNVNLQATNSITVNAGINASGNAGTGNLTLTAPIANLNQPIELKAGSTLNGTAATVNVGAAGRVQNGVDVAASNGTVNLAATTYTLSQTVSLNKNLTLTGAGADNTIISGNNTVRGIGVGSGKTVTIEGLSIVNGDISSYGGGGILNFGNLTVNNSSIRNNNSNLTEGGGIRNDGTLTINNSTLSSNYALDSGAISNLGTLTLNNSTLSSNTAFGSGGAMQNYGSLTVNSSTITGNTALGTAGGILNHVTMTIRNSIIAGNNGNFAGNIFGGFTSNGNNIFGHSGGSGLSNVSSVATDIIPTIPLNQIITPLGNYGGSTQTHALQLGSPAINNGSVTSSPLDQRGNARVGTPDIGAVESQGFTLVAATGNNQNTTVGQAFATPLTAKIVANNPLEPIAGGIISFTTPTTLATATITNGTASVDAAGNASTIATANTKTGNYTISASAAGVVGTANFNLANLADVPTAIVAASGSGQSTVVNTNFANNIIATVTDQYGNRVPNSTVTFSGPETGSSIINSSAITDANGNATIALQANTKVGSFIAKGTVPGVAGTADFALTNLVDVPNKITAISGADQSTLVNTNFANNLVVTVTDQFDNPIVNSTVTFNVPGTGASGTFTNNTATTNANGVATIALKANAKAGLFTTKGSVVGTTNTADFTLTNLADVAKNITTTSGSGQSTVVNRNFENNLVATVTDQFGNPIANSTVTFTVPNTGATGILSANTAITDANGNATIALKANTKSGSFTAQGNVNGLTDTAEFALTNLADSPTTITTSSGSNQVAVINTNFANTLVATVTDQYGNRVPNSTVTFTVPTTGASGTFAANTTASAITDANGNATIALTANDQEGAFTAQGRIIGIAETADFSLNNFSDIPTNVITAATITPSTSDNSGTNAVSIVSNPVGEPIVASTSEATTPTTAATGTTETTTGTTETTTGTTETTAGTTETTTETTTTDKTNPTDSPQSSGSNSSSSKTSVSVPAILTIEGNLSDDFKGEIPNLNLSESLDGTLLREVEQQTGERPALIYLRTQRSATSSSTSGSKPTDQNALNDTLEFTVVTARGNFRRSLPINYAQFMAQVSQFRREVTNPIRTHTTSYLPTAQALYKTLIEPLKADLKTQNITNLVFLAESGLRSVPFAALHDGKGFLIEQYSLAIMPSLSLTQIGGYKSLKDASLLMVGVSKMTQNQTALPMVQTELNTISKIWGKNTQYLDDRATRATLQIIKKDQNFRIVHLATHANFISGQPKDAYIQLWNDRLQMGQIKDLDWNKPGLDLLVLSACKTAVGDHESELGFAGLAIKTGVKTTIASLWSVNDTATMSLMSKFYEGLSRSSTITNALRQSQLAMIRGTVRIQDNQLLGLEQTGPIELPEQTTDSDRKFSHPYFWAAFTLVGNPW